MTQLNMECKVTFTMWWYVTKAIRYLGIRYPLWIKRKTIAWITSGNNVKQVKLIDAE